MCPVPVAQLNGTCRGNPILTLKFNITQPYLIQPKTAAIGNFLPDHFRSVCPCSRFVLFVVQLRREREREGLLQRKEKKCETKRRRGFVSWAGLSLLQIIAALYVQNWRLGSMEHGDSVT